MPMKGSLLWDEVAARHNTKVEKAQKDYDMAPDAFDTGTKKGRTKVKEYKEKLDKAKKGR